MADLKPGDLVQLKSGGPNMTVDFITVNGKFCCVWFVDDKKMHDSFSSAALQEAPSGHIDQDETV